MDGTALSDKEWELKRVDALMELKRQLLTRFTHAGLEEIRDQNLTDQPDAEVLKSVHIGARVSTPHQYGSSRQTQFIDAKRLDGVLENSSLLSLWWKSRRGRRVIANMWTCARI